MSYRVRFMGPWSGSGSGSFQMKWIRIQNTDTNDTKKELSVSLDVFFGVIDLLLF